MVSCGLRVTILGICAWRRKVPSFDAFSRAKGSGMVFDQCNNEYLSRSRLSLTSTCFDMRLPSSRISTSDYAPICLHLSSLEWLSRSKSSHPYSILSTFSPIARLLVRPGLSIPKRLTHPSNPSSRLMTKSWNPFPAPTAPFLDSFGRIPT